ncbi:hypothetical protein C0075_14875 [Rhizobium sp. KAs_5_22]|uniref:hypothetical protein n=1 Tax=Ciceribacter selenitireducens TaxID=448181 RepID=UPI00048DFAEA|nr:hypothetical protein [Ciceribacter selenitireducens]PPJ46893.1 hypothetical protein C0075_14875 [Rhizobium sp. KAs_5_22]
MAPTLFLRAGLVGLMLASGPALAEDIDQLPVTATFVISGGAWEGDAEPLPTVKPVAPAAGDTAAPPPAAEAPAATAETAAPAVRNGYYKLIAIRQPDRTAKVYLQQILSSETGPQVLESVELEEFTTIRPYVTDIRPEDSTGVSRQPGFFATVYLKTDPAQLEPEGWTVLIDEFGEIRVERETN